MMVIVTKFEMIKKRKKKKKRRNLLVGGQSIQHFDEPSHQTRHLTKTRDKTN